MLVAATVMSVIDFRKIGNSVDSVLKNNYQSIESAKKILDALEREDSGILLWMIGDTTSGRETVLNSQSIIDEEIKRIEKNITEHGEENHVSIIRQLYADYHSSIENILKNRKNIDNAREIYETKTTLLFFKTKRAIDELMLLNQDQMYRQSDTVKEQSRRAMMPAFASMVAAVFFSLMLYFFIYNYCLKPVKNLTECIKDYYPNKGEIDAGITTNDEFKVLEEEINRLIYRFVRNK